MGLFGTTKKNNVVEAKPAVRELAQPETANAPISLTRVTGRTAEEAPSPTLPFGIDHAIQLMRSVPMDQNVELVVSVVKTTLESLNVRVADIVRDAIRRQKDLEARVGTLKGEIATLEKQMELRVAEIVRLEAEHSETSSVRQRLELADTSGRGDSAAPKPLRSEAPNPSVAPKP